jgi:hypothetical protein
VLDCMAYSSSLKMEVVRFSETSVNFHQTTRHNNAEYSSVQFMIIDVYLIFVRLCNLHSVMLQTCSRYTGDIKTSA